MKLADLVLLCANCRRMAHTARTYWSVQEQRAALKQFFAVAIYLPKSGGTQVWITPDEEIEAGLEGAERQRLLCKEVELHMATIDRKAGYRFKNRALLAAKATNVRAGSAAPPWLKPEHDAEIVAICQKVIE